MNPGLFNFCCCYPVAGSEKPRLEDPRIGVGTGVAFLELTHSNDRISTNDVSEKRDIEDSNTIESARSPSASNPESKLVMNGPQPKELPSSPSPLSLPPIQEPEDEDSIQEATIETLPPRVDVTRTSATEPPGTTQAFVLPHNLNAQATADPEDNPGRWDRAELVLAISAQLTPIPEAGEEDLPEDRLEASNPDSSPPRSADEQNSTLRAVTSTVEKGSEWPSSQTATFTSTSIVENPSSSDIMQPENFLNPASWNPPDPDANASSAEDTADASDVSANDVGSSIFDLDEDYHSDTSTYTASLLSDVKDYAYENGRRYHSYREGHYVLPNDEQEQDRQDLLHHVRNLVLNGALFRAPLEKSVQRVLDIGTGTGIWAIDFADSYPSAEVIGTDLSPIQPSWVPPNLRFIVDDAEEPWLFSASRPFDFIHARDLGGAIADWPRLLRQAYAQLKPGGWIELQEFEVALKSDDDTMRLAPTLCEYLGRLHEASEAFQRPMNIAEGHRQRLVEVGFENVRDEIYKVCMP